MALAVSAPFVAPSGRVLVDEADGNVAFGAADLSRLAGSTAQHSDGSTTGLEERTISFNQSSFSSFGDDRVITTSDGTHVINWEMNRTRVRITRATWLGEIDGSREIIKEVVNKEASPFAQSFTETSSNSISSPPSTREKRQEPMILYGTNLNLPVGEIEPIYENANMYIKLEWTFDAQSGTTTSGVFAISNGATSSTEYNAKAERIKNLTTGDNDQLNGSEDHGDSASPADTLSTQMPALPSSTTTGGTSIPTISQSGGGGGGSSSSSGGSSLPPGAIAGIVIGSVLGLSLIAFLVWFFLRRRRRADHVSDGAYGSGHNPHEYLADKEAHARVPESPHSPYSDDGQHPQQQPGQIHHHPQQGGPDDAVPGSAVSAAERSPLTPYGEEEHTPIAARSVGDVTRSGAPSSTPNVTTNVSHLIEDGMTAEEIRRLEDEERALDDAIEQAGQGQGRGRQP